MACQKVFSEKLKSKKKYFVLEKLYSVLEKLYLVDEEWNEKLEEKFDKVSIIIKNSEIGDESKIEEVFYTTVNDKYSRVEFSLEETYRIFDLIKNGLDKCQELDEDLYYEIKDFNYLYHVYKYCYKSL